MVYVYIQCVTITVYFYGILDGADRQTQPTSSSGQKRGCSEISQDAEATTSTSGKADVVQEEGGGCRYINLFVCLLQFVPLDFFILLTLMFGFVTEMLVQ